MYSFYRLFAVLIYVLYACALPAQAQKTMLVRTTLKNTIKVPVSQAFAVQNLSRHALAQQLRSLSTTRPDVEESLRRQIAADKVNHPFPSINRTNLADLRFDAYRLSPAQQKFEAAKYTKVMDRFAEIKQSWDARMFYLKLEPGFNKISIVEHQRRMREFLNLLSAVNSLSGSMFSSDPALQKAREYLVQQIETLEPMLLGAFREQKPVDRTDRKLVADEFFLHNPDGSAFRDIRTEDFNTFSTAAHAQALQVAGKLPKGLRIAVINDHSGTLASFRYWASQGFLGEEVSLALYESAERALQDMSYGRAFDVVVTDLNVPGGGGVYLTRRLRDANCETPVIALSEYKETDLSADDLFNQGFDGYIMVDESFKSYNGYRVFPQSLANYFHYKSTHGWQH